MLLKYDLHNNIQYLMTSNTQNLNSIKRAVLEKLAFVFNASTWGYYDTDGAIPITNLRKNILRFTILYGHIALLYGLQREARGGKELPWLKVFPVDIMLYYNVSKFK